MTRGTTPDNIFSSATDIHDATVIWITYTQQGRVAFEKTKDDIDFDTGDQGEHLMTVTLTQEDTLKLDDRHDVEIQIRAKFADGTAIASKVIKAPVGKVLKEGII